MCVVRGIGGYHSAVESGIVGELKRQWTSSCFHHIFLLSPHNISICVWCVHGRLSVPCSPPFLSSPIHRSPPSLTDLPSSLAPLSSCFSGFLNCDISRLPPSPLLHLPLFSLLLFLIIFSSCCNVWQKQLRASPHLSLSFCGLCGPCHPVSTSSLPPLHLEPSEGGG